MDVHAATEPEDRALRRAGRALEIALAVEGETARGRPADAALSRLFRENPAFGSRDRRFYGDATFAAFRWRGWTGTLAARGATALVLARWLDGDPLPPALAALGARAGLDSAALAPLGPATLEERAAALARATGAARPPGAAALVPEWVGGALADGEAVLPRFVAAVQERPPLWLRARDGDGPGLAARVTAAGFPATAHPFLAGAVRVDAWPHLPSLARQIGPVFDAQDLSSQAVVAACAPRPGERWWDACAGAGGKTFALADRLGAAGHVLSTDPRASALRELARRARELGVAHGCVRARAHDATRPLRDGEADFDGVLVDAPCSGLGTWGRNPDARWRSGPDAVAGAARRQRALLAAAARAVRPGGRLVYSVCTLTGAETAQIADAFAGAHAGFAPDPFPPPLGGDAPPADRCGIGPWEGPCAGMFIARWLRT